MSYSERDAAVVWHPYTQMQIAPFAEPIVRAEGVFLYDQNDRPLVDAISSWWVNIHGHCHPYIVEKVTEQLKTLDHVLFAGFTHPKAVELAERLLVLLPQNQRRIFYSDNGSTAVEVALKMAIQYWYNRDQTRRKIIHFEGAYHGDTFGAMASSAKSVFTRPFQEMLFETETLPLPNADNIVEVTEQLAKTLREGNVAAFIYEPLVQGAAGFKFYEASYLNSFVRVCREHGVLTIADEVLTGFDRTGSIFASNTCSEVPDIICLSKALTGGFMPLAVTSCSNEVYEAFLSNERHRAFFHGHSYTANPVACAAACASLDLLESEISMQQRTTLSSYFMQAVEHFSGHSSLGLVRSRGHIFAADIVTTGNSTYFDAIGPRLAKFFLDRGVVIRPLGNVFYVMPPYCIGKSELDHIFSVFEEFVHYAPRC